MEKWKEQIEKIISEIDFDEFYSFCKEKKEGIEKSKKEIIKKELLTISENAKTLFPVGTCFLIKPQDIDRYAENYPEQLFNEPNMTEKETVIKVNLVLFTGETVLLLYEYASWTTYNVENNNRCDFESTNLTIGNGKLELASIYHPTLLQFKYQKINEKEYLRFYNHIKDSIKRQYESFK